MDRREIALKASEAARAAAERRRHARYVKELNDRGWICIAPGTEASHEVGSLLADICVAAEEA